MLGHTKRRSTEKTVVLTFRGPESKRQTAIDTLARLGFVDTSGSTPLRDAFPEFEGNESGTVLRGARLKEELTQKALAEKTGIPQRHISESVVDDDVKSDDRSDGGGPTLKLVVMDVKAPCQKRNKATVSRGPC